MKRIDFKDAVGAALSAGVGVLTFMIYKVGKSAGKIDAYADCSNQLNVFIEKCKEIESRK